MAKPLKWLQVKAWGPNKEKNPNWIQTVVTHQSATSFMKWTETKTIKEMKWNKFTSKLKLKNKQNQKEQWKIMKNC